ncbi:hypothetical protein [Leucobacter sp. wl10]|uniref:hypothetical protein n=1 Tax=Leucobacter sp. wl10 TaxID=2304677 RepID=UPI000E5C0E86|nr:hypothetical protein [Leucobacter sp. wl10]RGE19086.1 hypothetical protein D1J51_13275 [Leucobacter sp. wl10]
MRHHNSRSAQLASAALLLVLLTSCTPEKAAEPTPSPSATESPALPPTDHEHPVDDAEIPAVPEAGAQSQDDAIAAATKVMETFARPQLSDDNWWRDMLPLLSQQGAHAYEGTDPTLIPVTQVTGAGKILEGSTEVLLIVRIPTDNGPYNITLTRPDTSSPWLAERIRPAEG